MLKIDDHFYPLVEFSVEFVTWPIVFRAGFCPDDPLLSNRQQASNRKLLRARANAPGLSMAASTP